MRELIVRYRHLFAWTGGALFLLASADTFGLNVYYLLIPFTVIYWLYAWWIERKESVPEEIVPPESINVAALAVIRMMRDSNEINYIQNAQTPENFTALGHHTLGRWIRNNWGLWKQEGPLYEELNRVYGLTHADDLSSLILAAAWCRFHNKGVKPVLSGMSAKFKQHWKEIGSGEPITRNYKVENRK